MEQIKYQFNNNFNHSDDENRQKIQSNIVTSFFILSFIYLLGTTDGSSS